MNRYFSAPSKVRSDWCEDAPLVPDLSVPDHQPRDTGLIDRFGNPILCGPNPVGFHHPKEVS